MSRIGKQPIAIPSGVEVSVEGNVLKFKKGAHLKELDTKGHVDVKVEDAHIVSSEARVRSAVPGLQYVLGVL